jgi:hypothetical protein
MRHSARFSYAFMLSLLFLGVEALSAALLVAPLHRLMDGVGYPAENYLSGLVIAVLPIAVGLILRLFIKDKILVPYAFALLFLFTAAVVVMLLIRQEYEIILTFFLPTLGICSFIGTLLFWGIYYAGKK